MGIPLPGWRHRGRSARWIVTLILAVAAGCLTAGVVSRAEHARAAFGRSEVVPVASTELEPGHIVTDDDVRWTDLPIALVPSGWSIDPVGRTVTAVVLPGEVVLQRRLSESGSGGPRALLPTGGRAIGVPLDPTAPDLVVGDRLDLYAPDELFGSGTIEDALRSGASSSGARLVARAAVVIAVDTESVTVGVTGTEAPRVARAALDGAITIALVAPG